MNALRDRFWSVHRAFDEPGFAAVSLTVAGLLVGALVVLLVVGRLGGVAPALRLELRRRYVAWLVMTPLVYVPILLGAGWTVTMVAAVSLMCFREFARATGFFREKVMCALVAAGIIALNLAALDHWHGLFVALGPLTFAAIAACAVAADRPKGYVQRIGLASLSFLFFGVCLGHLAYMTNDGRYRSLILLLLVSVAMSDVFAFTVGKLAGGPKLAPVTSPNKTVSGSIGALVLTTAAFALLGSMVFRGQLMAEPARLVLLGVIVSLAGQLGDLTISSVKRDVGIKDMGALIPGHGGVLDRCNSLLLAAPAMHHFVAYVQGVGADTPARLFTGG